MHETDRLAWHPTALAVTSKCVLVPSATCLASKWRRGPALAAKLAEVVEEASNVLPDLDWTCTSCPFALRQPSYVNTYINRSNHPSPRRGSRSSGQATACKCRDLRLHSLQSPQ